MKRKYKKLLHIILIIFSIFFIYVLSNNLNSSSLNTTKTKLKIIKNRQIIKIKDSNEDKYLLNPKYSICNPYSNNSYVLFIALVAITPYQIHKRNLIRSTWGSKALFQEMKLLFLMAQARDEDANKIVRKEFIKFNDVLMLNYTDSYANLTTKIMMGFNWVAEYCPNTFYVLRLNDDVIVNTFSLIKYLNSIKYEHNKIIGYGIQGVQPIRNSSIKFYVTYEEYNNSYYDPYVEGSAYLITIDLAWIFYNKYLNFHYPPFSIWLEDVYIGMLVKIFNTTIVDIYNSYAPIVQYLEYSKEDKFKLLLYKGVQNVLFLYEQNELEYFWDLFRNTFFDFKRLNLEQV